MKRIVKIVSIVLVIAMCATMLSFGVGAEEDLSDYEQGIKEKQAKEQRLFNWGMEDCKTTGWAKMNARVVDNQIVIDVSMYESTWDNIYRYAAAINYDINRTKPVTVDGMLNQRSKVEVEWPEFVEKKSEYLHLNSYIDLDPTTRTPQVLLDASAYEIHEIPGAGIGYADNHVLGRSGVTYTVSGVKFDIKDDLCTEFGFCFVGVSYQTVDEIALKKDAQYLMIYREKQNFKPATKEHPASYDWVYTSNMDKGEIGRTTVYYGNPLPSDPEDPPVDPGKYPLGDVNGDKQVNAFDYQMLKAYVLRTYTQATKDELERMDVTGDRQIDAFDYMIVKTIVLGTYKPKKTSQV